MVDEDKKTTYLSKNKRLRIIVVPEQKQMVNGIQIMNPGVVAEFENGKFVLEDLVDRIKRERPSEFESFDVLREQIVTRLENSGPFTKRDMWEFKPLTSEEKVARVKENIDKALALLSPEELSKFSNEIMPINKPGVSVRQIDHDLSEIIDPDKLEEERKKKVSDRLKAGRDKAKAEREAKAEADAKADAEAQAERDAKADAKK